jgi:methylenetetrahydrofolate reductase (NADPH)
MVALGERARTTTVRDVDVFDLVDMARQSGLYTGVVLDPHPAVRGLELALRRLRHKVAQGAQFVVTQPVYSAEAAAALSAGTRQLGVPVFLGILPLRTARHARFIHEKVDGIAVPEELRLALEQAADSLAVGLANAREMLAEARQSFAGACLMPPFEHYEVLCDLMR